MPRFCTRSIRRGFRVNGPRLLLILLFFLTYIMYQENSRSFKVFYRRHKASQYGPLDTIDPLHEPKEINLSKYKLILGWTKYFGDSLTKFDRLSSCPELNCVFTTNRSYAPLAHAVVFHGGSENDFKWSDIPKIRNAWQRYVYLNTESPLNSQGANPGKRKRFFNWTMTYRMDSDIPAPYGGITKDESEKLPCFDGGASRKAVVWLASNCRSASFREKLVKSLQTYIPVTVIGDCGQRNICSRYPWDACNDIIVKNYKFILSLENSICKDYVTEKFWSRWHWNLIPIVLKRKIYEDLGVPSEAFIAVDDFASVEKMAAYLHYLHANSTAYGELLQRKCRGYKQAPENTDQSWCGLCKKLRDTESPNKSYYDMHDWWIEGSRCDREFVLRRINT